MNIRELTDGELARELERATGDHRAELQAELIQRRAHRDSIAGHDPSLCVHPVQCHLIQRTPPGDNAAACH